ncbi:MAG: porin family protein [Ignavibacteria bacterium]
MKSKTLSFLILIFLLMLITVKTSTAQVISYGIKGGLNLSDISGTKYRETKTKTGFNLYAFAEYAAVKIFSVSAEAGYTQKGFETTYEIYEQEDPFYYEVGQVNATLSYIDISVLAKLKIHAGTVTPYIIAGPSFGILTGEHLSSIKTENNNYNLGDLEFFILNFKTNTFGIKAGAGAEFRFSKLSVLLEARYNADLSVSYERPEFGLGVENWNTSSSNIKNNVFEFLAGVKF